VKVNLYLPLPPLPRHCPLASPKFFIIRDPEHCEDAAAHVGWPPPLACGQWPPLFSGRIGLTTRAFIFWCQCRPAAMMLMFFISKFRFAIRPKIKFHEPNAHHFSLNPHSHTQLIPSYLLRSSRRVPGRDQADLRGGIHRRRAGGHPRPSLSSPSMPPKTTELICAVSRHVGNLAVVGGRSLLLMAGGGRHTCCFTLAAILDIFSSPRKVRSKGGFIIR